MRMKKQSWLKGLLRQYKKFDFPKILPEKPHSADNYKCGATYIAQKKNKLISQKVRPAHLMKISKWAQLEHSLFSSG